MGSDELLLIAMAMGTMAVLFSTVGHGGGSGYLAVMAVASVAPETMRPMALSLNLAVAAIATWRFGRTGTFRSDLFGPLIAVSVPAAFLGGLLEVPGTIYRPLVGVVLVIAAVRLLLPTSGPPRQKVQMRWLIAAGLVIGVSSGIIGVGGGIFLSPLVLLAGWATPKETAAITAPFILINSAAGLLGITVAHASYPVGLSVLWPPLLAVLCGGFLGSWIGTHHLGGLGLRRILSVVLICAGIKMFLPLKVAPERTPERAQERAQERA